MQHDIGKGIRVPSVDEDREFTIYQIGVRDPIPVTGTPRYLSRFETETGESVRHVDDDTFILATTGETLKRVR